MKIIKWEYATSQLDSGSSTTLIMQFLDQEGSAGWELVHLEMPRHLGGTLGGKTPYRFVFKRPCGYVEDDLD